MLLSGAVAPGELFADNSWATSPTPANMVTTPTSQPTAGQWRTVPQTRFRPANNTAAIQTVSPQRPGWNLQWRRSPLATADQQDQISRDAYQHNSATAVTSSTPPQPSDAAYVASNAPAESPQSLQRATWLVSPAHPVAPEQAVIRTAAQIELPEASGFAMPEANAAPQSGLPNTGSPFGAQTPFETPPSAGGPASGLDAVDLPNSTGPQTAPEWFENPFRDQSGATANPAETANPQTETIPTPEPMPEATDSFGSPQDSIRGMLDETLPGQPNADVEDLAPPPKPSADAGAMQELESVPDSPSDLGFGEANPFDREDNNAAEVEDDDANDFRVGAADIDSGTGLTCDEFRRRIQADTIDKLSLDISPPFRPDIIEQSEFERLKSKFDEAQEARTWRDLDGKPLATGRLADLAYEKAVILTEFGSSEEVPLDRLSEPDRAYISENWGLPNECVLPQVAYQDRHWHPLTMTYMASNLCHKPLYFEEVNLERYGHTAGPLAQPIISSAHFFLNIAVLPYKMGVHSPHECQYSLGYYRPGNCAPWIIPPVPISLKGALYQATAVATTAALVP